MAVLLVYINTLYYLRGFEQTSWLVQTLAAITVDSLPFLLTKHKRRIHEKTVKNHLCPDCGASFSERTQLLQHTKYIHEMITDEKIEEILCFTCGLVIKSKIGLEKHAIYVTYQ